MSYVFISYSSKDREYASRLAELLKAEGFDVWIDNLSLRSGADWWKSIVTAIWRCDAFIVVLSKNADQSKWVQREVAVADRRNKTIFPLLRDGDLETPVPVRQLFVHTHIVDVRDGDLPSNAFYSTLERYVSRIESGGKNVMLDMEVTQVIADASNPNYIEDILNPPQLGNPRPLNFHELEQARGIITIQETPKDAVARILRDTKSVVESFSDEMLDVSFSGDFESNQFQRFDVMMHLKHDLDLLDKREHNLDNRAQQNISAITIAVVIITALKLSISTMSPFNIILWFMICVIYVLSIGFAFRVLIPRNNTRLLYPQSPNLDDIRERLSLDEVTYYNKLVATYVHAIHHNAYILEVKAKWMRISTYLIGLDIPLIILMAMAL